MIGTVIRQHLGHYIVRVDRRKVMCALSTRLRKNLQYPEASPGSRRRRVERVKRVRVTDPVAIGDRVKFDAGEGDTGMIRDILPRKNKVARRTSGTSRKEQIMAANVDRVVPIFSVGEPPPEWNLLDRMLAIAEHEEIPVVICLNKVDLPWPTDIDAIVDDFERIGYPIIQTSTVNDTNHDAFAELLSQGITLFMGPSGVGKSSLLNWLQPGLELRTGEISNVTGEGKHTTTHLELVALDGGGMVGDVPGVKEFRFWGIESDDVPTLFREFVPHLEACKFRDCAHDHEPECGVKQAVEKGTISNRRYQSYLELRHSP